MSSARRARSRHPAPAPCRGTRAAEEWPSRRPSHAMRGARPDRRWPAIGAWAPCGGDASRHDWLALRRGLAWLQRARPRWASA
eukprot:6137537-Pyramimonas_sp.AAC.1